MADFHIGGCFAPPLTDEKLTAYKTLAESAPGDVRAGMQKLIKMVEVFRETPDSSEPGRPHPSGFGVIVPLHAQEIERIWDDVPWDDEQPGHHVNECAVYAQLFDGISTDATARHSVSVAQWQKALTEHVRAKHFPDASLFRKIVAALKTAGEWAGLLTPDQEARNAEWQAKLDAFNRELRDALVVKHHDELPPYPKPEGTALRDAAFHLLWYAKELAHDREPITTDKL